MKLKMADGMEKAGFADGIRCDTEGNIWASAGWAAPSVNRSANSPQTPIPCFGLIVSPQNPSMFRTIDRVTITAAFAELLIHPVQRRYNPRPSEPWPPMEAQQIRNEVKALHARFDALRGYL